MSTGNFQDDDRFTFIDNFVKIEMQAGVERVDEPVFQLLIALLSLAGLKGGASYFMRAILDAPYEIGVGFVLKRSGIAECR